MEDNIIKKEIEELYKRFDELKTHNCEFIIGKNDPTYHLVKFDKVDKLKFPKRGVYFLMVDGFVSYVGMSESGIKKRIFGEYGNTFHTNHSDTKLFESFKFINLEHNDDDIKDIEYKYINMFNPPQNIMGKHNRFTHLIPSEYKDKSKEGKQMYDDVEKEISLYKSKKLREAFSRVLS
jgi:hypothetical protein